MTGKSHGLTSSWKELKASSRFRNFLIFLIFVALSTIFWFIMTLNDSAQDTFDVRLNVLGVPDSVTFINDPPSSIHVTVRDKGTRLFRAGFNSPKLNINFREYASSGVLRFSASDLNSSLKSIFGPAAQITTVSIDSLHLSYTTEAGKRVPIVIKSDIKATSGKMVQRPSSDVHSVLLYSASVNLDTVGCVYTRRIVKRNLDKTTEVQAAIQPIPGVKIVPSSINVTIPVEPMVRKTAMVPITVRNLPGGYSLLLFPDNVEVSYFVPMSRFNSQTGDVVVSVDFNEAFSAKGRKLGVHIESAPDIMENIALRRDSVEFTLVR